MNGALRQEMEQRLIDEYWLLDHDRFEDWLNLLTEDLRYRAPVRENLARGEEDFERAHLLTHFDESRVTIGLRVARLRTGSAHAEEPPSRIRHFVSNIKILAAPSPERVNVASNFIVFRSRPGREEHWFVGSRRDWWVRAQEDWLLQERLIVFDHDIIENITVLI